MTADWEKNVIRKRSKQTDKNELDQFLQNKNIASNAFHNNILNIKNIYFDGVDDI